MESDDSKVLTVGPNTSPQMIVIIGDLNNDLTDVTLNNISKAINNNTNVKDADKTIDSVENNNTIEKTVENNNKIINFPTIKTSKPEDIVKTINSVEIADIKKDENIDKAMEYLANENKNEIINNSTVKDDFIDESDDKILNISTDDDDNTFNSTGSTKRLIMSFIFDVFFFVVLHCKIVFHPYRETESYNEQKQKNKKETSKRKRLRQLKKLRYQSDTLGVTRKEDFMNESAWIRFQNFIDETRTKCRKIVNENRKLKQKITFYQNLLKYMNKKIIADKVSY